MRSVVRFSLPVVAAFVVGILGYAAVVDTRTGTWTPAGELTSVRAHATTVLLFDGRVLVAGGRGADGSLLRTAELFASGTGFSPAAPMVFPRSGHAAVALFDGRVLVTGGETSEGTAVNTAEMYDPWTDEWHLLPSVMSEMRTGHTATLLDDGRVLIAGGEVAGVPSSTIEVFDPTVDAFHPAGVLSAPRSRHAAALLADGRVVIAGGFDGNVPLASIDIVDPDEGWVSQAVMSEARSGLTATALLDGRVLFAGGSNASGELASTELYDPATGSLGAGAALTGARSGHLAFLLPHSNAVLLVGGTAAGAPLGSSELYYPWASASYASGAAAAPKSAASGTPLDATGQLLAATSADSALAETYQFATVSTERDDYSPGETVTISGSGWQPGETVTLALTEVPDLDRHEPFTAIADRSGNFVNSDFVPDEHDLNVRFYLTAKGASSQAQTTFTDASTASDGDGSMSVSPTTVTSGTTNNNFVFTFLGDNGKTFDAGSQVKLTVPSEWTDPQTSDPTAPGYVSVTGATCVAASIASVTATSVTVAITCDKTKGFTLSYAKVTAPTPGSTTAFTFTTETKARNTFVATDSGHPSHPSPIITVNVPPCTAASVMTSPADLTITYGDNATFTATGAGSPAPTVQWQMDSGSGFADIPGATANTLTVTTPAVSATATQYRAVFTNSCSGTKTATTTAATLTVNPALLTVTADNQSRQYGAANPTFTSSIAGFVNGETLATSGVSGSPSLTTSATTSSGTGTYAITPALGTLAAVNYGFTFVNGTLTITKALATATADNQSKLYGAAVPALTVTYTGLLNGDTSAVFSGAPDVATTATSTSPVGTYPITVAAGTLSATNYDFAFVSGTLTIQPAPVVVTADPKAKTYGDTDPALTYQITSGGLVAGDTFAGALTRAAGEDVGSYAIEQGTLALSTNYTLTYVGATLTISPRPITVTADAQTKVYGQDDPALTYHLASGSLVTGDGFSGALTRAAGENAGTYPIQQGSLTLGTNYALSFVGADLTITPAPLTVTADDATKVYGQPNPSFSAHFTGFVLGDGPSALGGSLAYTTSATAASSVGTYPVTPSGLTSTNYTISFVAGILTITPATPTVVITGGPFVYDTTPHAATVSAQGIDSTPVSGSFSVTYDGSTAVPVNAGTYTVVANFTSGDPNYKNASGTGSLVINKANQAITLAGVPTAVTLGEGPFTISASASSGLAVELTASGSCTLSGNTLSIAGPGTCTVTARQGGNSNYNPAPDVTRTFNVVVSWSNVLQPINLDGSSVFKYPSTIPVKFRLTGASAGVTNLVATITVARVSNEAVGSDLQAVSTSAADSGNMFRYDPSAGQYIFNLSTKLTGMTQGTWQISINLGDGVPHTVFISTKN